MNEFEPETPQTEASSESEAPETIGESTTPETSAAEASGMVTPETSADAPGSDASSDIGANPLELSTPFESEVPPAHELDPTAQQASEMDAADAAEETDALRTVGDVESPDAAAPLGAEEQAAQEAEKRLADESAAELEMQAKEAAAIEGARDAGSSKGRELAIQGEMHSDVVRGAGREAGRAAAQAAGVAARVGEDPGAEGAMTAWMTENPRLAHDEGTGALNAVGEQSATTWAARENERRLSEETGVDWTKD